MMPKENKQSIFWFGLDENLRVKIHNKIFEGNPTSISADVSQPLLQTNCSLKDLILCLQEIVLEQESPNTENPAPDATQIEMFTLAEKRILYQYGTTQNRNPNCGPPLLVFAYRSDAYR